MRRYTGCMYTPISNTLILHREPLLNRRWLVLKQWTLGVANMATRQRPRNFELIWRGLSPVGTPRGICTFSSRQWLNDTWGTWSHHEWWKKVQAYYWALHTDPKLQFAPVSKTQNFDQMVQKRFDINLSWLWQDYMVATPDCSLSLLAYLGSWKLIRA